MCFHLPTVTLKNKCTNLFKQEKTKRASDQFSSNLCKCKYEESSGIYLRSRNNCLSSCRCWHCGSWISNLSLLAYCLQGSASSCHPHSHIQTLSTQLTSDRSKHHSLIWALSQVLQSHITISNIS